MKIVDIDLDSLDRTEYRFFIATIINYYSVLYSEELEIKVKGRDKE